MTPSCASSTTWLALAMLLWVTAMATAARQEGVPSVNVTIEAKKYYKKATDGHHYNDHDSKHFYYPHDTREDNRLPGTQVGCRCYRLKLRASAHGAWLYSIAGTQHQIQASHRAEHCCRTATATAPPRSGLFSKISTQRMGRATGGGGERVMGDDSSGPAPYYGTVRQSLLRPRPYRCRMFTGARSCACACSCCCCRAALLT